MTKTKQMDVRVQIDLSVPPAEKHIETLRSAARHLTSDRESVHVNPHIDEPKSILAEFTVPRA